jgi:hypothetical protein
MHVVALPGPNPKARAASKAALAMETGIRRFDDIPECRSSSGARFRLALATRAAAAPVGVR